MGEFLRESGSTAPALAVKGLRKVFTSRRKSDVVAVDDVSFSVMPGEVVGLLGPNGAGKTTTIRCILGLVKPTAGQIRVNGFDASSRPKDALKVMAAVLEGSRNIYWRLTALENLLFFASARNIPVREARQEAMRLLEAFDLADWAHREAGDLSRGMQQKVAICAALIGRPDILLLDEPTLGLDIETAMDLRAGLLALAREEGRTIVISSHEMGLIQEICQRVIIINKGRVVVDDRVDNLLELFRARAYTLHVDGALPGDARQRLEAEFPMLSVEEQGPKTLVHVELPEAHHFYTLVDICREEGAAIESIDRRDPDLAQIFLTVVKGQAEGAAS